jgi:uncharacterized membrane protein YkvA (DUF1232 family)
MDARVIIGIVLGIAALWVAVLVLFWLFRPKGVAVREVLAIVPDVVRLLRSLIGDRAAPLDVRIVLVGLVAWIISPIDLIPELIPVLGPIDDIVVAVVAMRFVRWRMGVEDLRGRWSGSPDGFQLLLRVIGSD